jgi:hypothetical protein
MVVLVTNWTENSDKVLQLETDLAASGFLPMGSWVSPSGHVFYRVEALSQKSKLDDVLPVFSGLGFTLSGGKKDES